MGHFPIQLGFGANKGTIRSIPWSVIEPHDAQARHNHGGQTLARLAERGGLSACEAVAVLEDREWHSMPIAESESVLRSLIGIGEQETG
jgi:hypothetical protein